MLLKNLARERRFSFLVKPAHSSTLSSDLRKCFLKMVPNVVVAIDGSFDKWHLMFPQTRTIIIAFG